MDWKRLLKRDENKTMHSNAVNFEYIYPQMLYSKIFARTIQYKSHELFLMSKFLNYVRGKYDHEIMEKKIHILPDLCRKTE